MTVCHWLISLPSHVVLASLPGIFKIWLSGQHDSSAIFVSRPWFCCFHISHIYLVLLLACEICPITPVCHVLCLPYVTHSDTQDREDSNSLLSPDNVDKQALQAYARETARYVTNGKLSRLDFALNARGEPDVEVFDFTRMFAAAYSCRILEQNDSLLMQCLIGDGLFEVSLIHSDGNYI